MLPSGKRTSVSTFFKVYGYFVSAGIVLFGLFAMYFPEYDHPIYGRLDFGRHHVLFGAIFVALGAGLAMYVKRRKPR
jgi:hypothetical protein